MSTRQLTTAFLMSLKQLVRNRTAVILLFVIPAAFFAVTVLTTKEAAVAFKLPAVSEDAEVSVNHLHQALVFMALSSLGLLAAFLGLELLQRDLPSSRRLAVSGYRAGPMLAAKFLLLIMVIVAIGAYMLAALRFFFAPFSLPAVCSGLVLLCYIYGSYGMLIGSLVRRQLEGILCVALLVNIDVGWLQNPLFYADAMNRTFIRWLPAFYPSQVTLIGSFTAYSIVRPAALAIMYGTMLAAAAAVCYWLRIRPRARRL